MRLVKNLVITGIVVVGVLALGRIDKELSTYHMDGEIVSYLGDTVKVKLTNGETMEFNGSDYKVGEKVHVSIQNIGDDLDVHNDEVLKVKKLD